ncbi:putative anti-sigma regulatory factor, serine/threonine protein kinase [Shewanella halifaxensis HAW-EB4]|uniref:Anti-sigma regulatory factor, serine/threonine protein kinase n=1 Tax=Shewanella halifaxensis (strain HAW-EB4) TaxID=458817 RepID=B0TKE4_SHEHH|nr:ATP-binding protein [Shewanella halifaxensis]ABZ78530.1 putative anti-sigma regulatory factor, serine/threonine protein kinase [Shewanella halifaxensis HAW-EB4]
MNTRKFHKQYSSSLEASRTVASDILPFWQSLDLDVAVIGQMELCLVELVNNVFEHAYANLDGAKFDITSYLTEAKQLIIEVSDYGSSMPLHILENLPDTDFIEPIEKDPTTWLQSNRGLKIIQQLSDAIEYSSNKNKNTFKLLKKAC